MRQHQREQQVAACSKKCGTTLNDGPCMLEALLLSAQKYCDTFSFGSSPPRKVAKVGKRCGNLSLPVAYVRFTRSVSAVVASLFHSARG